MSTPAFEIKKAINVSLSTPSGTPVMVIEDHATCSHPITFTRTRSQPWAVDMLARDEHGNETNRQRLLLVKVEGRTGGFDARRIFLMP